jgi:type I restriction enzyme S subunit
MNLDTFFKKFDEFAEAPNAVQKMRELILELAVRGKLVEQDENDIHASVLLDELKTEKLRLKKLGDLKIETSITEVLPDEMFFQIPDSWKWARLSDVTSMLQRGKSPDYVPANGLPVISQRCVQWTGLDLSFAKMISKESLVSYETYRFIRDEDLLWNSTGTGTIGRIVRVSDLPDKLVCDSHVTIVRCLYVVAEYIRIWLRSASVYGTMETTASGSTNQIELTAKMAKLQVVPLPPLAEQKRIVAKVDELMALCDRLEAQEAERKEKGRRLSRAAVARFAEKPTVGNLGFVFHKAYDIEPAEIRKAILELAVRGKLVEQNSRDETAHEKINKLRSIKKYLQTNCLIVKDKSIKPIVIDDEPYAIPGTWQWIMLGELAELITKGSSPKWQGVTYVARNEGVLFITSENVGNYNLRKINDLKYVNKRFNEIEPRSVLKTGDILMTLVGASIGRTAIYNLQEGANINQAVALVRLIRGEDAVLPQFLLHYLNCPIAIASMLSSRVVSAQPNISLTDVRRFMIPLPPLAEQKRIVAKVDELMAIVDTLEAELTNSRALAERLLDAAIAAVIENAQRQGASRLPPQTSVADEELREAFLISRIVSKTADPEHPIGRFRRTKFSYLAHRRAGDDVTKHYIKKAAGPYSPWAKFDGPEDMARARGYVRDTKADPLEGMMAGERVGEVEEQVTDPLIGKALDWVMKNFHFETNDSLELLTTVDFAAVGLQKEGKEISREAVKKVIANSKDWTGKLKRELFSDENIDKALKRMAGVFPEMYGK